MWHGERGGVGPYLTMKTMDELAWKLAPRSGNTGFWIWGPIFLPVLSDSDLASIGNVALASTQSRG